MNLNEIRGKIDSIDSQLIELISERMECSRQVAEYKKENGMAVFDPVREAAILERVAERGGIHGDALKQIWATLMEQSRVLQYPYVDSKAIRQFADAKDCAKVKVIACQGIDGAYSALVGRRLYPNAQILFFDSWAQVCEAVASDKAEFGILPVENSWAGSVHEVYDLLIGGNFCIAQSANVHIRHNLIGLHNSKPEQIKQVVSHPQALRQCGDFIDRYGVDPIESSNTAVAVKSVAESGRSDVAAIGSADAARIYGLSVIESAIASSSTNTTRFVAISKQAQRSPDADKISTVFSAEHTAGSLYRILAHFASTGMSLTKLESRPIHNSSFEYRFYADLSGNLDDPKVAGVLATLSVELPEFLLLGNYPERTIELD